MHMEDRKQSVRIQTSILNAAEKKLLVWIAARLPRRMTSNHLTFIGMFGALVVAVGYTLSVRDIQWLWLASFGFVINWFGDSLDGSVARVRGEQRPVYGFFLDHNIDCINEMMMFVGVGLSPLMNMDITLVVLALYLMLSVSVYIDAHLKNEFKLTYGGLGPTEFRIIVILVNTCFIFIRPLREFLWTPEVFGHVWAFTVMDIVGIVIALILAVFYAVNLIQDARYYAKVDPRKK